MPAVAIFFQEMTIPRNMNKALQTTARTFPPWELILFTRFPEPGRVKTRLIPALGPTEAARIHRLLTEKTIREIRLLQESIPLSVEVYYTGGDTDSLAEWLGPEWEYRSQVEGDLGGRMARALDDAFRRGMERVVLIGSDCPEMKTFHLRAALKVLDERDLVLGPAEDGGYYLIGLKRPCPDLFHPGLPWGTERVLEETIKAAAHHSLAIGFLERLRDLDRPEDLKYLATPEGITAPDPKALELSVIIPALNEGANLAGTIRSVREQGGAEIILVDGGSSDETRAAAREEGARVFLSPPGRSRQLNLGAAMANGERLLFLHADTSLPVGFDRHIRDTLSRPGVAAGAFRLQFEPGLKGLSFVAWAANRRAERWQLPYGDQGLFLSAATFREVRGYPETPFLEDVEIIRRLRRFGRIEIARAPVVTSARRWKAKGVWRTTLFNQIIMLAYLAGVPHRKLAGWYYGKAAFKSYAGPEG